MLRHGEPEKNIGQGRRSKNGSRNPGLTEDGKKEIIRIAKSMKRFKITFDTILTSPLNSATQTAEIVSNVFKMKNKMIDCDELLPEGNIAKLYGRLHQFATESSILVVGHEPYLTNIIYDIISRQQSKSGSRRSVTRRTRVINITTIEKSIVVKKGGLAKISIISTTPELKGELRWLLTPRIIKSLFGESKTVVENKESTRKPDD